MLVKDSVAAKIIEAMHMIKTDHIENKELQNIIAMCIDHQQEKGFPFGELTYLHYAMLNGPENGEIFRICAAVELLILCFDILDDFEDQDCVSLDKPWLSQESLGLNAATALMFLSVSVIRNSSLSAKEDAVSFVLKFAVEAINGQHVDLLNQCRSEQDYIEMTLKKSGALVSLACLIGAVLAQEDYPKEIEVYSRYIGVIAQLANDLEDMKDLEGKNDLMSRKYTLPTMFLLNQEESDEGARLIKDYFHNKVGRSELLAHKTIVTQKIIESGALVYTEVMKRTFQKKALAEVQKLPIAKKYYDQLIKYFI